MILINVDFYLSVLITFFPFEIAIGDSVLARFSGDGLVYRARVGKIDPHQIDVIFLKSVFTITAPLYL